MRHVSEVIATEGFVTAVAAQCHGHVTARFARDVVGRHARRVGKRLVERGDDAIEHVVEPRLDHMGVMLGVQVRGRQGRRRQLVVRSIAKPDRRGDDGGLRGLRHARHDQPGIDSAGEERAERHLAFEPFPHASLKVCLDFLDRRRLG